MSMLATHSPGWMERRMDSAVSIWKWGQSTYRFSVERSITGRQPPDALGTVKSRL